MIIYSTPQPVLKDFNFSLSKCISVSFVGATNFSSQNAGVQSLILSEYPHILYIHCRAHLLQLALVHASSKYTPLKLVISAVSGLYSLFHASPKRTREFLSIQAILGEVTHKLVQPCENRLFSYDRAITVVTEQYESLLLCFESLYNDDEIGSETGRLFLLLRDESSLLYLTYLSNIYSPLCLLSQSFQSSSSSLLSGLNRLTAMLCVLREIVSYWTHILESVNSTVQSCFAKSVFIHRMSEEERCQAVQIYQSLLNSVISNIQERFNYKCACLAHFHSAIVQKPQTLNFSDLADLFHISDARLCSELQIFRQHLDSFSDIKYIMHFISDVENGCMFHENSLSSSLHYLSPTRHCCSRAIIFNNESHPLLRTFVTHSGAHFRTDSPLH